MKRIAAIFLALLLLPMFAASEEVPKPVYDFVTAYNSHAPVYAVQPLPLDSWNYSGVYYNIYLDESLDTSISIDLIGDRYLASIIVPPGNVNGDFIAICACMTAAIRGESQSNYADILSAYFALRNAAPGERITHKTSGGTIFLQQEEDLFLFAVTN